MSSIAAPVTPDNIQELEQQLLAWSQSLDSARLNWASGYLAGLSAARQGQAAPAAEAENRPRLTIWYGSETGNGRGVAERLAAESEARGFAVDLASAADIPPRSIGKLDVLLLVMSTHGDGDPPEDAQALHKLIMSERAPKLAGLKYAVFALGDSSYPDFCQTGREFDSRLAELGATRLMDRVDVDVDFEPAEDAWRDSLLKHLEDALQPGDRPSAGPHLQVIGGRAARARFDRRNPFNAEVLDVSPLTIAPATGTVRHVELALDESGLEWQPGDSAGIWPSHDARLVEEILEVTGIDGERSVRRGNEELPASAWLKNRLELTQIARPFVEAWADLSESAELRALLADRDRYAGWVQERQVIDILRDYPARVDAQTLIGSLRGIAPRLYSIASSPLLSGEELHLTVSRFGGQDEQNRLRAGVASWQLCQSVQPGEHVPLYIESNPGFRLPDDPDRPVLMIGPGTGVAPFRAFLQHRQAQGAKGRNWLVFGNRNRRLDFLYQLEWQRFQREGVLHRLSVAFSRDQQEKIYVQHRLREQGRELFDWLEQGAHVYICGDRHMASDVHQTLSEIIAEHGGSSNERAAEYLEAMKQAKRYQKDVY